MEIIKRKPSVDIVRSIMGEIETATGITADEILSDAKRADIVYARHTVIHRLHALGFYNYGIALRMQYDHSTITHVLRRDMSAVPWRYQKRVELWQVQRQVMSEAIKNKKHENKPFVVPMEPIRPASRNGGW